MQNFVMPVGNDIFEKIREDNYYYIDKSLLIKQILDKNAEVTLITRPRRFGKSLNMSMLDCFFDIRKDSRNLFEGLAISNETEFCEQWQNKYPTIFITLKYIDKISFESSYSYLKYVISQLYNNCSYILKSNISEADREMLNNILFKRPNEAELCNSLYFLTKLLYEYYNKPVIVLIDEYDVPMSKGSANGYYREITDIISSFLGSALKTNPYLNFAVLTGCLRIAKESIFTVLNNLYVDSIFDDRFDEYFGFTDSEMDKLLEDTDLTEFKTEIKEWYDGYRFGNVEVYCPWDVINYISQLQYNRKSKPRNYWANTSGNDIIRKFLDSEIEVSEDFEALLRGEYVEKRILENITYDELTDGEDNFWTVLYLTGYLTAVNTFDEMNEMSELSETIKLRIPNKEIRILFENTIAKWFRESIAKDNRSELFNAVWSGDEEKLTEIISDYLYLTISYFDYNENYYHAFLTGLFSEMKGYIVASNSESGKGRADIILKDKRNKRVAIFELKRAKSEAEMSNLCGEALRQIEEMKYTQPFKKETVFKYGAVFYKKDCLIKCSK